MKEKAKYSIKNNNGITLIALVVTIIVLIILAGVTINLIYSENGLISKIQEAKKIHEREQAKEKLELELANLYAEKTTNEQYNQNEYITKRLEEKGFFVKEDIVIVDNWEFIIDRSIPCIKEVKDEIKENEEKLTEIQRLSKALDVEVKMELEDILTDKIYWNKIQSSSNSNSIINYIISDSKNTMPIYRNNTDALKMFLENDYVKAMIFGNANIEKNQEWIDLINEKQEDLNIGESLIPIMTSNTEPSGVVTVSSYLRDDFLPYYAFDGKTTSWIANGISPCWIMYEFPEEVSIYKVEMRGRQDSWSSQSPKTFIVQGSNNGETFVDLGDFTAENYEKVQTYYLNNYEEYKYIRFYITSEFETGNVGISYLQYFSLNLDNTIEKYDKTLTILDNDVVNSIFKEIGMELENISVADLIQNKSFMNRYETYFEAKDIELIPKMTSNTEPSGKVTVSSCFRDGFLPYYAFDGETTSWVAKGKAPCWIMYEFPEKVSIYKVKMRGRQDSYESQSPKTFIVQGSNDGSTFIDLGDFTVENYLNTETFYLNNLEKYKYIRFYITSEFETEEANVGISYLQYFHLDF